MKFIAHLQLGLVTVNWMKVFYIIISYNEIHSPYISHGACRFININLAQMHTLRCGFQNGGLKSNTSH